MICINCGTQLTENCKFCPTCGTTIVEEKKETLCDESTVAQNEQEITTISEENPTPVADNSPENTAPVSGNENSNYNNYQPEQQTYAPYFNNPAFTQHAVYDPGRDFAVASMVLGIVSFLLFCSFFFGWPGTFITTITGIVLGVKSIKKSKQVGISNGMAVAGIITSSIALALVTGICLLYLMLFITGMEMVGTEFMNELI